MNDLIDVEKLLENVHDENVEETLKILLEEHRKRIIKSLQLIQIYVELDKLKEAYEALTDWMNNKEKIKKLCGFHWIIEGWNKCLNV